MRVWLLLLVVAGVLSPFPSVAGHPDDGTWYVEDDEEDQEWEAGYLLPEPPTGKPPHVPHMDIVRLTLGGEDETGITFDIQVSSLSVRLSSYDYMFCPYADGSSTSNAFFLDFRLGDEMEYRLAVALRVPEESSFDPDPSSTEHTVTAARACLYGRPAGEDNYLSGWQRAEVTLDDANDRIHVRVPKMSLLGQGRDSSSPSPRPGDAWPDELRPGAEITDVAAFSIASPGGGLPWPMNFIGSSVRSLTGYRVVDRTSVEAAPRYTLQKATANEVVKVDVEARLQDVPVGAGQNQTLSFVVTNSGSSKRIVVLEYLLGGPEERQGAYQVFGPGRVTIPGGESRPLNLAVNVGADAKDGDNVTVTVRGRSVGFADEVGVDSVRLVPGPALGPEAKTLFILPREEGGYCDSPLNVVFDTVRGYRQCVAPFLSPNLQDPSAAPDSHLRAPTTNDDSNPYLPEFSTAGIGTTMMTYLDMDDKASLRLVFDQDPPLENTKLLGELAYQNGTARVVVAKFEREMGTLSEGTVFTMDAPIKTKDPLIPRGSSFTLGFAVHVPDDVTRSLTGWTGGVRYRPGESYVSIPLIDLPPELRKEQTVNPLQLAPLEDRDNFVNPGKSRLFNFTLLNQGGSTMTAKLAAAADHAEWTPGVVPAEQFRLEPGDTLRLGLLVQAPATATEGERVTVVLNVTDEQGRSSALTFFLTAVSSVELSDDSEAYRVDADATQKAIQTPKGKSPMPMAGLVLVATVGAALVRARRR